MGFEPQLSSARLTHDRAAERRQSKARLAWETCIPHFAPATSANATSDEPGCGIWACRKETQTRSYGPVPSRTEYVRAAR